MLSVVNTLRIKNRLIDNKLVIRFIVKHVARFLEPHERLPMRLVAPSWLHAADLLDFCTPSFHVLWRHAREGNIEAIQFVTHHGEDVRNLHDHALIITCRAGQFASAQELLRLGCDVHAQHEGAIIGASSSGNLPLVKYLYRHGADYNAQFSFAYHTAAYHGNLDVMKWLRRKKADVCVCSGETRSRNMTEDGSALSVACGAGRLHVAQWLYAQGADVDWGNGEALRRAQIRGHLSVEDWIRKKREG